MKNKEIRKIQSSGWMRREYKEIRELIKRIDRNIFDEYFEDIQSENE